MPLWAWRADILRPLTRLICLEGADETSYQKAEHTWQKPVAFTCVPDKYSGWCSESDRQPNSGKQREAHPGADAAPIMYVSADVRSAYAQGGVGGRAGKQA